MPFGVGSRICGGQNLAQLVLRIVVAVVVRSFEVRADIKETNERSMEIKDAFVSSLDDANTILFPVLRSAVGVVPCREGMPPSVRPSVAVNTRGGKV